MLKWAMWADDETHQWGELVGHFDIVTRQAKRIAIYLSRKLVIINPVEDGEPEASCVGEISEPEPFGLIVLENNR